MRSEGNPLCVSGSYALAEEILKRDQPKVIFDVGAHEGNYLSFFYSRCPDTKVHAFEPHPRMCEFMMRNFRQYRPLIRNVALSDKCEMMRGVQFYNCWTLGTDENKPKLDLVPSDAEHPDNNKFDVMATTLDGYCGSSLVPGFIKVDVDGYEAKFLRGGTEILKKHHPPMMMELSYLMLRIGDSVEQWVKDILDLGYKFASMDGKVIYNRLEDVLDCYPYNTSFDVMLI